jgi:hypothetical protein
MQLRNLSTHRDIGVDSCRATCASAARANRSESQCAALTCHSQHTRAPATTTDCVIVAPSVAAYATREPDHPHRARNRRREVRIRVRAFGINGAERHMRDQALRVRWYDYWLNGAANGGVLRWRTGARISDGRQPMAWAQLLATPGCAVSPCFLSSWIAFVCNALSGLVESGGAAQPRRNAIGLKPTCGHKCSRLNTSSASM